MSFQVQFDDIILVSLVDNLCNRLSGEVGWIGLYIYSSKIYKLVWGYIGFLLLFTTKDLITQQHKLIAYFCGSQYH